MVPLDGSSPPKELTSGEQGATHSPVISNSGNVVAWLELAEDGYESDRAKVVLYDLTTSTRLKITEGWDRSPDSISFNKDDKTLYLTAGEHAHVKIFSLPVPTTGEWK